MSETTPTCKLQSCTRLGDSNAKDQDFLKSRDTSVYCTDTAAADNICSPNKITVKPRNNDKETRATTRLGHVYTDITGLLEPVTARGGCLIIIFVDDFSRTKTVYLLRCKNNAAAILQQFKLDVVDSSMLLIDIIRSDQGGTHEPRVYRVLQAKIAPSKSSPPDILHTKTAWRNGRGGP